MKLRLNSIKEGSQTIEMTLTGSDLAIADEKFNKPIQAVLNIYKGPHQTTIKSRMKTAVTLECDRCLKPYEHNLEAAFQAILSLLDPDEVSDENIIPISSKTREVDLSPFAHDALLIELPMKSVCSDSCKGICAGCGADLNKGKCTCKTDDIDDRWKPLNNLLINTAEE